MTRGKLQSSDGHGGVKNGARTFQSAATLERSTVPKNSANARFFHIAADWKVRAPFAFLTPPCVTGGQAESRGWTTGIGHAAVACAFKARLVLDGGAAA